MPDTRFSDYAPLLHKLGASDTDDFLEGRHQGNFSYLR